ncbi:aldo/keto reductase [Dielma fastidiosa]|uniref:aldo/keto reductase n=1 Tax=Dielma fastidiosa TaxID=1034346 RepID=UPI000E4CD709|nr:aldo/keto reductase [Dielma fastidiosa]RHM99642.1 aldo/keto reductase [Dielma fastidiosa]
MEKREFANTGIMVSAIGLGCMGMSASYGERNDEESIKTLQRSLELGIDFWDTSDIYGNGDNEKLISKVLTENRNRVFIATKVGFRSGNDTDDGVARQGNYLDGRPEHIKKAVSACLDRLGVECIDLLYLHRVDPNVPVEDSIEAMAKFVEQGKVKYLGISECTLDDLNRAHKIHPISAVQSEYSLVERTVEKNGILQRTKEINAVFVPFAPLGRGLITNKKHMQHLQPTDFRYNIPRYNGEHRINNENLANELDLYAKENFNATVSQLAIAWVLAQQDNIIPIPGTKRRIYLEENVKSIDIHLSERHLKDINAILDKYPNVGERYAARQKGFLKK